MNEHLRTMVRNTGKGFVSGALAPRAGISVSNMIRPPPPYFAGMTAASPNLRIPLPVPVQNSVSASNTRTPFGFSTVDNVTVPYIMRGEMKFVSVKMVENKLLSKFPKINMDDMNNVGPIFSYYISESEAKLLTEIGNRYNQGMMTKPFSTKDLIVSLQDFETFYNRAKHHFTGNGREPKPSTISVPSISPKIMPQTCVSNGTYSNAISVPVPPLRLAVTTASAIPPGPSSTASVSENNNAPFIPSYKPIPGVLNVPSLPQSRADVTTVGSVLRMPMSHPHRIDGGWVQINNTVVPYLLRSGVKFVPLSVIKYAAGLLTDVRFNGYKVPVTEEEYEYLNNSCKTAGVNFTFSMKTKIIKLELVIRMSHSKVVIHELPQHDPFTHAQWSDEYGGNNTIGGMKTNGPINVITPTGVHHMPPKNPFLHRAPSSQSKPTGNVPPAKPALIPIASVPPETMQAIAFSRDPQTPSPGISPSASATGSASSTPTSRPSSAQSRNSITPPPSQKARIKSLQFEGKTISCLIREGEKEPFALLEALVRLYFTQCSLVDFQTALEQVLNVAVSQLTDEEEAAFIRFYGLRVKSLRCKSIVSFDKFKVYYVQLKYIFANKTGVASPVATQNQKSAHTLPAKPIIAENNNTKDISCSPVSGANHISSSAPAASNINDSPVNGNSLFANNENGAIVNGGNQSPNSAQTVNKRKSSAPVHLRKAKVPKRLEDTVAKLKLKSETQITNSD